LDPFKPYIDERLIAGVWNAVVLLRELRQLGYVGGYSTVKEEEEGTMDRFGVNPKTETGS